MGFSVTGDVWPTNYRTTLNALVKYFRELAIREEKETGAPAEPPIWDFDIIEDFIVYHWIDGDAGSAKLAKSILSGAPKEDTIPARKEAAQRPEIRYMAGDGWHYLPVKQQVAIYALAFGVSRKLRQWAYTTNEITFVRGRC